VSVTLHLEQCVRISFENKRKSLEAIKSLTLTSDRMGEKMRSIVHVNTQNLIYKETKGEK